MRSFKTAMCYASKELTKTTQLIVSDIHTTGIGRWWGAYFRNNLPWADHQTFQLSEEVAIKILRLMRKYAKLQANHHKSLTIFCNATWWYSHLSELIELYKDNLNKKTNHPLLQLIAIENKLKHSHTE